MTDVDILRSRLSVGQPDLIVSDEVLTLYLDSAKGLVMDTRYPFNNQPAEMPSQFEAVRMDIAVELYQKIGAEGQTAHSESGIDRTYAAALVSPGLIRRITPLAKVL